MIPLGIRHRNSSKMLLSHQPFDRFRKIFTKNKLCGSTFWNIEPVSFFSGLDCAVLFYFPIVILFVGYKIFHDFSLAFFSFIFIFFFFDSYVTISPLVRRILNIFSSSAFLGYLDYRLGSLFREFFERFQYGMQHEIKPSNYLKNIKTYLFMIVFIQHQHCKFAIWMKK